MRYSDANIVSKIKKEKRDKFPGLYQSFLKIVDEELISATNNY